MKSGPPESPCEDNESFQGRLKNCDGPRLMSLTGPQIIDPKAEIKIFAKPKKKKKKKGYSLA
jgi:hypothetical protein